MDWSPNRVHQVPLERMHLVEAAVWDAGYSFVHMSPTERQAELSSRLFRSKASFPLGSTVHGNGYLYSHIGLDKEARFLVCRLTGASSNHVPVMFVAGNDHEFRDQRALSESKFIPSGAVGPDAVKGAGWIQGDVVIPGEPLVAAVAQPHGTQTCPSCNTPGAYRGFTSVECMNEKCQHYKAPAAAAPAPAPAGHHEWVAQAVTDLSIPFACKRCGRVERMTILAQLLGVKEPATENCPGKLP